MKFQTANILIQLQKLDMPSKCLLLITLLSEATLTIMGVGSTTTAVRTMFGLYGVFMLIITYVFFEKFANRESEPPQSPMTVHTGKAVSAFLLATALFALPPTAKAQSTIAASNIGEGVAYGLGHSLISSQLKDQSNKLLETNVLLLSMGAFKQIEANWEEKYKDYMSSFSNFASKVKASSMIVTDMVKSVALLKDVGQAVADNPEGVLANLSMSNLYMESFMQMGLVVISMKEVLSKDAAGAENLLTGPERCRLMYDLEDKVSSLNGKLHQLSLGLRTYNLSDVWYKTTAGIVKDRDYNLRQAVSHAADIRSRAAKAAWQTAQRR